MSHHCHDHCHQHPDHDHHPATEGYYWRDYTGEIPEDAFPGGLDINQKPTYIGQADLKGVGVIPTSLYPGQLSMKLACDWKANYSNNGMKILCTSDPNSLSWVSTTAADLPLITAGKKLVIGGFQHTDTLNVGRVMHGGELVAGKVAGGMPGNTGLYYVGSEKENCVASYQILIQN